LLTPGFEFSIAIRLPEPSKVDEIDTHPILNAVVVTVDGCSLVLSEEWAARCPGSIERSGTEIVSFSLAAEEYSQEDPLSDDEQEAAINHNIEQFNKWMLSAKDVVIRSGELQLDWFGFPEGSEGAHDELRIYAEQIPDTRRASEQPVSNQGRVRSDNLPSYTMDGLLFRSKPEMFLYAELRRHNVSFAPLPVFLRGGCNRKRIEPDFVFLKDGIVLIVEVDGINTHRESPVEASERLEFIEVEGARALRIPADASSGADWAKQAASTILHRLERIKACKV